MNSPSTSDNSTRHALPHPAEDLQPGKDLLDYAQAYAREKPEVVALWCFGVGFIVGWKLKPW